MKGLLFSLVLFMSGSLFAGIPSNVAVKGKIISVGKKIVKIKSNKSDLKVPRSLISKENLRNGKQVTVRVPIQDFVSLNL